jgi:hypothetical protein
MFHLQVVGILEGHLTALMNLKMSLRGVVLALSEDSIFNIEPEFPRFSHLEQN